MQLRQQIADGNQHGETGSCDDAAGEDGELTHIRGPSSLLLQVG
jgi:hypothetical protein